jgi:hypothetical protein
MFAFLEANPSGGDPGVRMMRPMLFRTTAVIVGPPAGPLLAKCTASSKDLVSLCQDTQREIDKSK